MIDLTGKTQAELSQMYDQVAASIRNPATSKDQAQALEKALITISNEMAFNSEIEDMAAYADQENKDRDAYYIARGRGYYSDL